MRIASILCAVLACSEPAVQRSAVTCGPCEAHADDFEQVRVRVELRDSLGRPVSSRRVLFGGEDGAVTGADGVATAGFHSKRAGHRLVQVRLPDGTPVGAVAVEFAAGSFPRADLR
jgi:hypothetical protein